MTWPVGNKRSISLITFVVIPLLLLSIYFYSLSPVPRVGVSALQSEQIPQKFSSMTKYIVTLKKDASNEEYDKAKKQAVEEGGKIVDEYTLIKGFVVEYPADTVHSLASNTNLNVEQDGEVHTQ